MTAANQAGASENPKWFKEYIFSQEFTTDLSPAGLDKLLDEMASKPDLVKKVRSKRFLYALKFNLIEDSECNLHVSEGRP